MKYKVGDTVRVVRCSSGGNFAVGDIVKIIQIGDDDGYEPNCYGAISPHDGLKWYLNEDEVRSTAESEIILQAKKAADAWRNTDTYHQAAQIIDALIADDLAALRGPTREMMERMFPGCEICKNAKYVTGSINAVAPHDDQHEIETDAEGDFDFCPNCGHPITDEAVDMMLRRWKEAVKDAVD